MFKLVRVRLKTSIRSMKAGEVFNAYTFENPAERFLLIIPEKYGELGHQACTAPVEMPYIGDRYWWVTIDEVNWVSPNHERKFLKLGEL